MFKPEFDGGEIAKVIEFCVRQRTHGGYAGSAKWTTKGIRFSVEMYLDNRFMQITFRPLKVVHPNGAQDAERIERQGLSLFEENFLRDLFRNALCQSFLEFARDVVFWRAEYRNLLRLNNIPFYILSREESFKYRTLSIRLANRVFVLEPPDIIA